MTDIATSRPPRLHRLTLAIALIASGSAYAATEQPAEGDQNTLPKITLTAQAKSQATKSYTAPKTTTALPISGSVREIPQSVSVITQQRMEDQGLSTLVDVAQNVTGINVQRYETNRGSLHARGFDIDNYQIDGVPTRYEQPWSSGEIFTSTALFDRIEVVRGATGLMTGPGNPSAAINMIRKRATSKKTTANLEVSGGSWDTYRTMGDVSGALNETGTARLRGVVEYQQNDSWIDLNQSQKLTSLLAGEVDITDSTLLSAGISYQQNEGRGPMWGGLPVWYSDGSRANWSRSKTTSADWTRWNTDYTNLFADLTQHFNENWSAKLSFSRGDRNGDSKLLYLYRNPDRNTGTGMSALAGSYLTNTKQDDISLQVNGKFDVLGIQQNLAFGYTYSHQDFKADSRAANFNCGLKCSAPDVGNFNQWDGSYPAPVWGAPTFYEKSETRQDAIYAAARLSPYEPLKFILGARLSNFEKTGAVYYIPGSYNIKHSSEFTPYAGIIYDINNLISVYSSYTSIFQPQSEQDINGTPLDPIEGNSLEGGIKAALFDGRLNGTLSLFKIKQDNLAQEVGPRSLNDPTIYFRAADGTESKGFEFELSGTITPDWNLTAGYSQFKATEANGKDVNTAMPRKQIQTFTTYRLPGKLDNLTVGGGVNWQSSTYVLAADPLNPERMKRVEQGSYAIANLMARYQISPEISAQLNVNNLFDEEYYGIFEAYGQTTWGAPRNATLMLRYKF